MTAAKRPCPELLDRLPPCDPRAEMAVLGSILHDATVLNTVSPMVSPEDFRDPRHAKLYGHLVAMRNGGLGQIDAVLLTARLTQAGDFQAVGGEAYLGEIIQSVPYAANAGYYAQIVRSMARRRAVIRLGEDLIRDGHTATGSTAELVRRGREALEQLAEGAEGSSGVPQFKLVSCPELASNDYRTKYLVRDVLVEDVPCMIGGQLKTLKSLLGIGLGIALTTGKPFLDTFEVLEAQRVVYFIGEGGLSVAQDYAHRIAASVGIELEDIGGLAFSDRVPRLADLGELDGMARALRDHEATVAFLDPLYLALEGRDSGNIMAQGPIFRDFTRVCLDAGCTPIIVHHLKKNRPSANLCDPPELAELAWSGPAEYAGQWLLLGRQQPYDPDEPGHHSLWLSCGGRSGHSSLHVLSIDEGKLSDPGGRKWDVEVLPPREARQEARKQQQAIRDQQRVEQTEADKALVLEALARFPAGETYTRLREVCALRSDRFKAALAAAIRDGEIIPCEISKSNRRTPYAAYKLAEG